MPRLFLIPHKHGNVRKSAPETTVATGTILLLTIIFTKSREQPCESSVATYAQAEYIKI